MKRLSKFFDTHLLIVFLLMTTTAAARADKVTIQFFLGEIVGLTANTVGILVADSAGNGFESITNPAVAGTVLSAGETLGDSDDVIIAVTQAQGEGFSGGIPGFGDTFGNIDYDQWGLSPGMNLKFYFFPGIEEPNVLLAEGQLYYCFDNQSVDFEGDIGYRLPSAPGVYTLSHLDSSHGGGMATIFPLNGTVGITAQGQFQLRVVAAGLSGDDALPDSIPFGDRVENLLKYAFNLDLSAPDARRMISGGTEGLPAGGASESGGKSCFRVEFVRRKGSGLVYLPLKSSDLSGLSWTALTSNPVVSPIDAQWERVVYEEPYDPEVTAASFVVVEVWLP